MSDRRRHTLRHQLSLAAWSFRRRGWHPDVKRLARLRALYWTLVRWYETEICLRCGGPVGLAYHAPDAIWEAVTGHARQANGIAAPGILCPYCLSDLAKAKGLPFLRWTCSTTDEVLYG